MAPLRGVNVREPLERMSDEWMLRTERILRNRERALVIPQRVFVAALSLVGSCESVQRKRDIAMIRPERFFINGQRARQ
jgi:hypothetical protein